MGKVLVTGAAGFIGHKTCEQLLDQGYDVVALDNLNDYYDVNVKNYRLSLLEKHENLTFYSIDIEDKTALNSVFKEHQFETIFNLAARAGVRYSLENPDIYVSTNIQGNLNLLNMAKEYNVPKFILASTSSLYAGKELPFLESLNVSDPISPYAATKSAAEVMCSTYHHLYDIDVSVVRYFTVYGPLSRPDMAQMRFMKWIDTGKEIQLYGDGEQARDFTFVDDIARGTILAQKKLGFEIINLGGGENPISMNTMIKTYEGLLEKSANIKNLAFNKADMKVTMANIDKAKKLLDWQPETSFEAGLAKCVEHYQANREFYQSIQL